jgi:acyl-CoA thioesterase
MSQAAAATTDAAAAQALAERVGAGMFAADRASRELLGMRLLAIGPGRATLAMTVREDMLNGHRICHGGLIFTLADSAFAFACNSYDHVTVAAGCSIEFLRPGQPGDTLVAEASERVLQGRTGIYDITVRNGAGEVVALFRGKSARIAGRVLPEAPAAGAAPSPTSPS